MILLSPVIVPIAILSVPFLALMVGALWLIELFAPSKEWHPWFAWRPVRHFNDVDWIWLERIERRHLWARGCIYRWAISE